MMHIGTIGIQMRTASVGIVVLALLAGIPSYLYLESPIHGRNHYNIRSQEIHSVHHNDG
jgi:hypothetical protein